jgi:hypothetical protein
MLTMVVTDFNECVFLKSCILIPNAHWTTKDNMKLFFVDLYRTTNHAVQKWVFLEEKRHHERVFTKKISH